MARNPLTLPWLPLLIAPALGCRDYAQPLDFIELWSGGSAPSRAGFGLQLVDAEGRGVAGITLDELRVEVDGEVLSEVTLRRWDALDMAEPLVLLLDASEETVADPEALGALQALALGVLDSWPADQPVQVGVFADALELRSPMGLDRAASAEAISGVASALGPASDARGAVMDSLSALDDRLDLSVGAERGLILVLTDGGDQPALPSAEELIEARGAAGVMVAALGSRGLAQSFTGVANQGVVRVAKPDAVELGLDDLRVALQDRRDATLVLSFCTDARGGVHELTGVWRRGRLGASWQGSFSATGFDDTVPLAAATDLPQLMSTHSAAAEGGWLYVGGGDNDGDADTFYAPILDDGRLGNWRQGPTIPGGGDAKLAAGEGHLYAVSGPLAWYAELGEAGAPGEWVEMDSPGYSNVLRASEGVLYSVSRDRAWEASIAGGGPAGEWVELEPFPQSLEGFVGMDILDGRLAVVGTDPSAQLQRTVGWIAGESGWEALPAPPSYRGTWTALASVGGYLLSFPGEDADDQDILSWSPSSAGWAVAGAFGLSRRYYSVAGSDDALYVHGGYAAGDATREGLRGQVDSSGVLALGCTP